MDKLKNLVSSKDNPEPRVASPQTAQTSRVMGQGSHFPQREDQLATDTTGPQGTAAGYVPGARQDREVAPTSGLSGPSSGTAAIGETSTYSSHSLLSGDAVGGVADPTSADPTTYKMPEHSYASRKGVPEGGPMAAAAAAFHKDRDYSTSNLPGAYPTDSAHDTVTTGPPSLATGAAQSATGAASASRGPVADERKQTGTVGKILGAIGLGTAAAGAGAATSRARDDTPRSEVRSRDQPTTTTGVDPYTAPTQSTPVQSNLSSSGQAPSHHRKESIPTTAYPAGLNSPAAISAPVGGTTSSQEQERDSHTGRNVGLAAAGIGAGAGAGAFGAHEYSNKDRHEGATGISSAPASTQPTSSSTTAPSYTQDNSNLNRGMNETTVSPSQEREGHTGRNVGLAATGLGAGAGAGALGAHEYEKRDAQQSSTGLSNHPTSSQPTSSSAFAPSHAQDSSNISRGIGQTPASTTVEPERENHGYGKTAAAAGVGAGAGAAGAYALGHRQPETERSDWPLRDDGTATQGAGGIPTSQRAMEKQPAAVPAQQEGYSTNAPPVRDAGIAAAPYDDRQRQKHSAREETALAGTAGTGAGAATSRYGQDQTDADEEAQRKRRRQEEEAALAGVAGAGAGAAGAHEYSKHHHEGDEARRQKEISEQEEARRKQFEKDQKAAEKEAKKVEKQQAKEEKAIAKEETKQQKALAKQESHHDKAVPAEHEQQERLDREARERREKEAAAAAGVGAAGGAAAYAVHDKDKHPPPTTATDETGRNKLHKDPPSEEKKPSLLKRLFGRRKNKDTGEDEDYEYEEGHEHDSERGGHHLGAAGVGAGTGAGVAGTAAATSHDAPAGSYAANTSLANPETATGTTTDHGITTGTATAGSTGPASNDFTQQGSTHHPSSSVGPQALNPTHDHPPYDPTHNPSSGQDISQRGEHIDSIGGLTASHHYAEGEQKPGLATRVIDALKPLPERDQLQQHSEKFHHGGGAAGGTGSNTHGTAL